MRTILSEFVQSQNGRNRRFLRVRCECGRIDVVRKDTIHHASRCNSCASRGRGRSHGMARSRPYLIWQGMKTRCDSNHRGYEDVLYDPKWATFEGFWDDMRHGYADNLSLDRIDPWSGYEKQNCRWATLSVQAGNIRGYGRSGYPNVYPNKGRWMGRKYVEGRMVYAGTFDTPEEAYRAIVERVKDKTEAVA